MGSGASAQGGLPAGFASGLPLWPPAPGSVTRSGRCESLWAHRMGATGDCSSRACEGCAPSCLAPRADEKCPGEARARGAPRQVLSKTHWKSEPLIGPGLCQRRRSSVFELTLCWAPEPLASGVGWVASEPVASSQLSRTCRCSASDVAATVVVAISMAASSGVLPGCWQGPSGAC